MKRKVAAIAPYQLHGIATPMHDTSYRVNGQYSVLIEADVGIILDQRLYGAVSSLSVLDERELRGMTRIRITNETRSPGPDSGRCYGYYLSDRNTGEGTAVICRDGYRICRTVILHEMGHHIFKRMTEMPDPSDVNRVLAWRWVEFWKENRYGPPFGKMPSWSAAGYATEGFAQVYENLRLGKRVNRSAERMMESLLKDL